MQPNKTDETEDKKFMRFDDSKKHSDDNFTLLQKKIPNTLRKPEL